MKTTIFNYSLILFLIPLVFLPACDSAVDSNNVAGEEFPGELSSQHNASHGYAGPIIDATVDGFDVTITIEWDTNDHSPCTEGVKGGYFFSYQIARADVNDPTNWLLLGTVRGANSSSGAATYVDENVSEGEYIYSVKGMNRCGTGKTTQVYHSDLSISDPVELGSNGGGGPLTCAEPEILNLNANPSSLSHTTGPLNLTANPVTFSWNVNNLYDCAGASLEYRVVVQKKTGINWNIENVSGVTLNWTAETIDISNSYSKIRNLPNNQDYRVQFQVRATHDDHTGYVTDWVNVAIGNSGTPAGEL